VPEAVRQVAVDDWRVEPYADIQLRNLWADHFSAISRGGLGRFGVLVAENIFGGAGPTAEQ